MAAEFADAPFYIEADCCTSCGVPVDIAPELFRFGELVCEIVRQPQDAGEIDKIIEVMWASEMQCIRYRGHDAALLRRLGESGQASLADDPEAANHRPLFRDHVLFRPGGSAGAASLATEFREYLAATPRYAGAEPYEIRAPWLRTNTVTFSWFERNFHAVTFAPSRLDGFVLATLSPLNPNVMRGLARIVDRWLKDTLGAEEIRWLSARQFRLDQPGISTPF